MKCETNISFSVGDLRPTPLPDHVLSVLGISRSLKVIRRRELHQIWHQASVTGLMSLVSGCRSKTKHSWTATSLHDWEMTAVFPGISNSCDSCGIDVGYHCVSSLATLKQINIGPSHRMLVEIESRRIWVRQHNNTKGTKKQKKCQFNLSRCPWCWGDWRMQLHYCLCCAVICSM